MKYEEGFLKKVRGTTVMLSVDPDASAGDILERGVDKQCACDCTLPCTSYTLLYPDGQLVDNLPGSTDVFTLVKYKLFIGKAYQKLVLYLCTDSDNVEGTIHDHFNCVLHLIFNSLYCTLTYVVHITVTAQLACLHLLL